MVHKFLVSLLLRTILQFINCVTKEIFRKTELQKLICQRFNLRRKEMSVFNIVCHLYLQTYIYSYNIYIYMYIYTVQCLHELQVTRVLYIAKWGARIVLRLSACVRGRGEVSYIEPVTVILVHINVARTVNYFQVCVVSAENTWHLIALFNVKMGYAGGMLVEVSHTVHNIACLLKKWRTDYDGSNCLVLVHMRCFRRDDVIPLSCPLLVPL